MTHYIDNYSYPYKVRKTGGIAKTTEKLTGLSRLSHFLVGLDSVEDFTERASGYIRDLLHLAACHVYFISSEGRLHLDGNTHLHANIVQKLFQSMPISEIHSPQTFLQVLDLDEQTALGITPTGVHWVIPLEIENSPVGIVVLSDKQPDHGKAFPRDEFYLVDLVADQLANVLHRRQLNTQLENSSIETVLALSRTLETRDPHSGAHSKRLAAFSERMAAFFGFSKRETQELCWAALLHDIGKIGIEDQILHKPGALTAREWEIMKTHSEVGAQIVRGLSGLENIATIILAHHERVDGQGYPHQLKGDQIPLGARIIAVVDSYNAITEGRIYRQARTHEEAMRELNRLKGKMYDPDVVDAFVTLFEREGE